MARDFTDLRRIFACALCIFAFIARANAADPPKPSRLFALTYCEKELARFCEGVRDGAGAVSCLTAHGAGLSHECQQEIERYLQTKVQASSRGGGALSSFGGLNAIGPPIPLASYEGRFSPGVNSPSFTENKGNISLPVYRSGADVVSMSIAGGDFHLGSPIALSSGLQVPADLYRVELGAQYFRQLPDQKNWGIRASVGSAGNELFQRAGELTYSLNINYGFPGAKAGYWIWFVFFSNNSPIGNYIPIPGFGYIHKTETFSGLFGFPVTSLQWTPVYPWSFSLTLFGPIVQSEVGYGSLEQVQFFLGYAWTRQSYIPSQLPSGADRLNIEEMKTGLGLRSLIGSSILVELQGGRAFDRSLYISDGLFNQNGGSASVASDWYMAWSLKAKL